MLPPPGGIASVGTLVVLSVLSLSTHQELYKWDLFLSLDGSCNLVQLVYLLDFPRVCTILIYFLLLSVFELYLCTKTLAIVAQRHHLTINPMFIVLGAKDQWPAAAIPVPVPAFLCGIVCALIKHLIAALDNLSVTIHINISSPFIRNSSPNSSPYHTRLHLLSHSSKTLK